MPDLRMPDINKVTMAGNLTRDPEIQYIANGTALCKFGIAVSRRFKTKAGEQKDEVVFLNVTAWGASAEWIAENIKKGNPVLVEGRLTMNEWEDKNTGQKRTAHEISAERVQSMSWSDSNKHGENVNYATERPKQSKRAEIEESIEDDIIPF